MREKNSAALSSVFAAVALTGFKLIVGLLTNSLGILAEAAHSALDLVAAVVTFVAVRYAGRPADHRHHYGHGKIENLSALFETLLLLVTCVWIIYESIQRLFFHSVQVDASIWAFVVMGASIVIDYSRSRILYRAAKKYRSQALEADALHFSTDIWSSSVVIIGLVAVKAAESFQNLHYLTSADAVAALFVAVIVIYVSAQLGIKTVHGLLDYAPRGLRGKIKQKAESIPGISNCHDIRVRTSGPTLFVILHVDVDAHESLAKAHDLTEQVRTAILELVQNADITIHADPADAVG